jgi:hypothetical protein
MPTDPRECHAHAARCEELAQTADTPEHARILLNLAKQWLKLAAQLERAEVALKERRAILRRR